MPMGMENPLLLMGGDFEFYCLYSSKIHWGFPNFDAFLSGDESSV